MVKLPPGGKPGSDRVELEPLFDGMRDDLDSSDCCGAWGEGVTRGPPYPFHPRAAPFPTQISGQVEEQHLGIFHAGELDGFLRADGCAIARTSSLFRSAWTLAFAPT